MQSLGVFSRAMQCDSDNTMRIFYLITYPSIFATIPYNSTVGFLIKPISYITSISWAHRDLFIINIAYALKFRFELFNEDLNMTHRNCQMSKGFWLRQRVHYRKLSSLVSEVDDTICALTFFSLSLNVFYICFHLFNGL